jgi:ATP-dependent protease ClpP protease subunit
VYIFIERELDQYRHVGMVVRNILACTDPTIYVYINSEGGDFSAGLSIYAALRLSGKKIVTYGMWQVCSAAVLVYLAGDERYAHDYTEFLIHEVQQEGGDDSKAKDKKRSADELENDNDRMFSLIAERTTLTKAKIKKSIAKAPNEDWKFSTADAKRFGIVHEVGLPRDSKRPFVMWPSPEPRKKVLKLETEAAKKEL